MNWILGSWLIILKKKSMHLSWDKISNKSTFNCRILSIECNFIWGSGIGRWSEARMIVNRKVDYPEVLQNLFSGLCCTVAGSQIKISQLPSYPVHMKIQVITSTCHGAYSGWTNVGRNSNQCLAWVSSSQLLIRIEEVKEKGMYVCGCRILELLGWRAFPLLLSCVALNFFPRRTGQKTKICTPKAKRTP